MLGDLWHSPIEFQQFAALREHLFFGAVGEKAEVTDAPVCVRHAPAGMKPSRKTCSKKRRLSGAPGAGRNEFRSVEGHRF